MNIRISKEFSSDLRLLADKIALGKIEPMESWIDFEELIQKHYGDNVNWIQRNVCYRSFSLYLQLFTFNRLMLLIRLIEERTT